MLILCNMENHPAVPFLKMYCAANKQVLHHLTKEEYKTPLGILAFGKLNPMFAPAIPQKATASIDFSDPMLLFAGMDQEAVSSLINQMKAMNLPSIPMKAVITPINAAWTAPMLHDALADEIRTVNRQK